MGWAAHRHLNKYLMRIEEINLPAAGVDYHKTLCPLAWDANELKPEVRSGLLKIAHRFIDSLGVPGMEIEDIVLTGSMANYNWTKFSDFDLHVITNYSDLDNTLADELFRAKKDLWNSEHDVTIKGHDVEVYVEDTATPPVSAGVFSLTDNSWVKIPEFAQPKFNDDGVDSKASAIMQDIDRTIRSKSNDPEDYQRISDKIRKMRRAGLDEAGEFSIENLAFKVLRNLGYLDILKKAKVDLENRSLSIRESKYAGRVYKVGATGGPALEKIAAVVTKRYKKDFPDMEVEYWQDTTNPKCWYLALAHSHLDHAGQQQADMEELQYIADKHKDIISSEPADKGEGIPAHGVLPWVSIRLMVS